LIQLQYGGKCRSNLGAFHVNQSDRTLGDILLEGANYVQDFFELFIEIYYEKTMVKSKLVVNYYNNVYQGWHA
jgi:hypothetical protein